MSLNYLVSDSQNCLIESWILLYACLKALHIDFSNFFFDIYLLMLKEEKLIHFGRSGSWPVELERGRKLEVFFSSILNIFLFKILFTPFKVFSPFRLKIITNLTGPELNFTNLLKKKYHRSENRDFLRAFFLFFLKRKEKSENIHENS